MSDEPSFSAPEPRSPWPAAVIGAVIHTGLWLLLFAVLGSALAEQRRTFDELHIQLPHATRLALNFGRLLTMEPVLAAMGLVVLFAADLFLLHRLGRGGYRVLRELWSGLMVLLPVVMFATIAAAIGLAHNKLTQALTRPHLGQSQAERTEREKLAGKWKLIAVERDGAAVEVPEATLTFTADGYSWDQDGVGRGGAYFPHVTRNPPGLTMWQADGPDPGITRNGLYKHVGDRLVLCLGHPEAFAENLPADFTTKGTTNELFTFGRTE